jgi:hypothetical protein
MPRRPHPCQGDWGSIGIGPLEQVFLSFSAIDVIWSFQAALSSSATTACRNPPQLYRNTGEPAYRLNNTPRI